MIYIGRLSKACQILDVGTSWRDEGVEAATDGLNHAHVYGKYFGDFAIRDISARLIRTDASGDPFAKLRYISFLFALRNQSEAPTSRLPELSGDVLSKSRPEPQSILGICNVMGGNRLIPNLSKRKNDRRVSILIRPCLCKCSILHPREFCPIRVFPFIRLRCPARAPIFSAPRNKNMNRILKGAMKTASLPDQSKYPHRRL